MRVLGVLLLATVVTFGLIFTYAAICAVWTGRTKVEPGDEWVAWRERPVRFLTVVVIQAAIAAGCWLFIPKLLLAAN